MNFIKSDFIKNASTLFSGSLVAQAIGFLVVPILTRIYSPDDFGVASLFATSILIFSTFSGMRYELTIVPEENNQRAKNLLILTILINGLWAIAIGFFIWAMDKHIVQWFNLHGSTKWLYILPIALFINGAADAFSQWQLRQKQFGLISTTKGFSALLGNAYKLIHKSPYFFSINGLVLGQFLAFIISFIAQAPYRLLSTIHFSASQIKEVARTYISFPKWGTPASLINVLGTALPVFILTAYVGLQETGYYSHTLRLVFTPLSLVSMAFGQVYFERLSRLKKNTSEIIEYSISSLKTILLVGLVPTLVVLMWGESLFSFVLGNEWSTAGRYAQVTVLFFFAMYISSPFAAVFTVYSKLKEQLAFTSIFTLLTNGALLYFILVHKNIVYGLAAYSILGITIRAVMMNFYFKTLEIPLAGKITWVSLMLISCTIFVTYFVQS